MLRNDVTDPCTSPSGLPLLLQLGQHLPAANPKKFNHCTLQLQYLEGIKTLHCAAK